MLITGRISSALFSRVLHSPLPPPPTLFWKIHVVGVGEGDFISSATDYCQFFIPAPGALKPQSCGSGEREETAVHGRLTEASQPRHDFTLHY